MSIHDRHFFFLSGEVFRDQALLLTFISAGLAQLRDCWSLLIAEQFIHVCVWLYVRAP